MKIIQNRTRKSESESESEEGDFDEESKIEMENPDSSEKNGYKPVSTKTIEDDLNLHTEGEKPTGEKENEYFTTENSSIRRSNRKCIQLNRYGGVSYIKNFGREKKV